MGGKSSVLQIFQAQKNFSGTSSAQVASSNQALTSMGWGVQRGGGGGWGGWCQASQVSAPLGLYTSGLRPNIAQNCLQCRTCFSVQLFRLDLRGVGVGVGVGAATASPELWGWSTPSQDPASKREWETGH